MATTTPDAPGGGLGPEGACICLKCGTKAPHHPGTPCTSTKCPKCGATMLREGSEHHRACLDRRGSKT